MSIQNNNQFILLLGILFLSSFSLADTQNQPRRGFLFYEDKQLPTIKPTPKKQKQRQPEKVSSTPNTSPTKPQHEPFSAAWLREKLPILLDKAMTDPTEENVRAYKYAERMMLDMSMNFADQSQRVVKNDPMLDANVRFPISTMARQSALYQIDKAKEAIIQDLTSKGGIWFFFDTKCRFCESQFKVIKLLEEKYGIETRYISLDGNVFQGMNRKKVRFDKGATKAKMLGVKITPATFLTLPPDKTALVSHGASSLDELEEKIVTAAIDMKVVAPELANVAEMEKRGVLTSEDLKKVKQQMKDPDDSDELVKMMNEAIRRKM